MAPLILVDATVDSMTVSWPSVDGAERYVLQYRKSTAKNQDKYYETLSDKLKSAQAKKKNLLDAAEVGFIFRAGAVLQGKRKPSSWVTHPDPYFLLSRTDDANRMAPPQALLPAADEALTGIVKWFASHSSSQQASTGYELQMRENVPGIGWRTIAASLSGTEVRKKNLTSKAGYQFRVRPSGSTLPFSEPSNTIIATWKDLSPGIKRMFKNLQHGTLLRKYNEKPIALEAALSGKEFVLLYVSAHWCGPCRKYTPQLSKWYETMDKYTDVEVVFLSADHDAEGFQKYYKDMPFLAVDYDEVAREELMSFLRVKGIPRLAVVDGRTGKVVEDNAVGKPFDVHRWRTLAQKTY